MEAEGGEERGGGEGHAAAGAGGGPQLHWCYQCNKEVAVEAAGDEQGMCCVECGSGFVEMMATAQAVPDVRRAQRRRRHQGAAGMAQGQAQGNNRVRRAALAEALEHPYPQQLMQVLRLLGQATHTSTQPPSPVQVDSSGQGQGNADALVVQDQELPVGGRGGAAYRRMALSMGLGHVAPPDVTVEDEGQPSSLSLPAHAGYDVEGMDREQEEGEELGAAMGMAAEGTDSEVEAEAEGMRLDLDGWDSLDEEEWEELDEDGDDAGAEPLPPGDVGSRLRPDAVAQAVLGGRGLGGRGNARTRDLQNLQMRTRRIENTLHQYLQDLLQNLVGQNIEVHVELPQGGNPLYVGNPGDYVDARGFEQLLQQMAENDSSRRGAPPASKSAVEALPTVKIKQEHIDQGAALCAICKEVVALNEPVKQLPCFHLYHYDCILPWLTSRNSCPVCRYELPTDDPDYEQEKQGRHVSSQNGNSTTGLSGNDAATTGGPQQDGGQADMEAVDSLESSISSSSRESTDSEPSDYADALGPDQDMASDSDPTPTPDSPSETDGGGPRGWLALGAGPVLSMMGIVLMLCLKSHLMGRSLDIHGAHDIRPPRYFQEPHLEQAVGATGAHSRSRWWLPFQR